MRSIVLLAGVLAALIPLSALANEWDRETVNDVVRKVKAGEMVDMSLAYPVQQTQAVWVTTPSFQYLIDIRAKTCYIRAAGSGLAEASCRSLKTGYPIIAPIIDWEK
jgi:hypothetical protein